MSELQKIRIKLKAYDHALLDQSAAKIIDTVVILYFGFKSVIMHFLF